MRSLSGAAEHWLEAADPIIVHPDVRRMLLTQKALAEGGRMFLYHCAKLVDIAHAIDAPIRGGGGDIAADLGPDGAAETRARGREGAGAPDPPSPRRS